MTSGPAFPDAIPAATIVVFRKSLTGGPAELLMLKRAGTMRFAGGAAVFPGGRVDPSDHELAAKIAHDLEPYDAASRIAGIRETLEEAGLAVALKGPISAEIAARGREMLLAEGSLSSVMEKFGWTLDLTALQPWARWCPASKSPFDTRFYLADLGTGAVEVTADETEHTHLFWSSANEALDMADRGEIDLVFPTRRNLERLSLFADFAAASDHARQFPVRTISPSIVEIAGVKYLTIPDDIGYPVLRQTLATANRG